MLEGTISGSVVATTDSRALEGVTVSLSLTGTGPGDGGDASEPAFTDGGTSGTTTTDAAGKFSFPSAPIGAYTLTFARSGFATKSVPVGNSVAGPTILAVTLASVTTPGTDAPTFQVTVSSSSGVNDPYAVGFGATVTIGLIKIGDTSEPYEASALSYAWQLSTGITSANPTGAYSFNTPPTSSSTSAAFTTMTLLQTKGVEVYPYTNPIDGGPLGYYARLGVVGINPDETGLYTVGVTVSDPEGHNYSFSQPVQSTWQTAKVANVPVGVPVYLQGDTFAAPNWLQQGTSFFEWPNTSWQWSFTSCSSPTGTTFTCPTLGAASTQFPSFVPAASGTYTLSVTESSSHADAGTTGLGLDAGPGPGGTYGTQTSTLSIYVGTYLGEMNDNPAVTCTSCHQPGGTAPDDFTPWQNTAHFSALQRKLDGLATSYFNESCMSCHTVGWSPVATAQTALNGGFYYEKNTEVGPDGGLWQYPSPMTGASYSNMVSEYPTLGYLGGIQCESCHGPAGGAASGHPGNLQGDPKELALLGARVSWNEGVCASCHEEAKEHVFPGQWAVTGHGNTQLAIQRASVESKAATYGGGADPQSGAQFCGRCHSAQGFAHYVNLLNNGATGRYDYLTTDDQKLDSTNAPTTTWLSSIGLNAAQVESQTCQTCHDPHGNGAYSAAAGSDAGAGPVDCSQQANNGNAACMQLRIYDRLPYGLPNGIGAISGVGEGALCMACHNGRNGEHTDTVNSSPYAETPHDSTATEALFGFNAFFVPRYSPSPHLAIQDTCSGCHVKLPTAAEADAGYSSNHSFVTDLSICQSCHVSASVDGVAIQSQISSEMASLGAAITSAVTAGIETASAAGPLCVQVSSISNPACTGGTCKSSQIPAAVPFPLPPSTVLIPKGGVTSAAMSSAGSTTVTLTLGSGVTFDYFDLRSLAKVGTTTSTKLSVAMYTILTGVTAGTCVGTSPTVPGTGTQLFPAANPGSLTPDPSIVSKAIWNFATLSNEGSGGIHNFPWTNAVIQATQAQIGNWKP